MATNIRDRQVSEGFSGREVAELAEITYRQLDYWARTHLIRPSLVDAKGSGSRRRYSQSDLVMLCFIKQMLDAGVNLDRVREAVAHINEIGLEAGQIVVLCESDIIVLTESNIDHVLNLMKIKPCQSFPIGSPELEMGHCQRHEYGHLGIPHPARRSCKSWEPVA